MYFAPLAMLIGGIALFLFGMMLFEDTIHLAFGQSIKKTIQKYANSLLKSIGIGVVSTAILQSSSVVTMIMLGFIGAGILSLEQGIGIVLGANIGTTLTPWLIALLGFKVHIEAFTLPIIALAGIFLILSSRYPRLLVISKFMFGFGLLFLGLGYMKESVDVLAGSFSLSNADTNLWKNIIMGMLITIVLQTSTGTSVMTLTALSSGMISFDIALGIMIGANIGTAISTFLVSSLSTTGKHRTKKAIAITHVLFNLCTAAVIILLFNPIRWFLDSSGLSQDPIMGIAFFHSAYSIIGVLCFAPLTHWYVKQIKKHKRSDSEDDEQKLAIEQCITNLPEEYIKALQTDVNQVTKEVGDFISNFAHGKDNGELMNDYERIKGECENLISLSLNYETSNCTPEQAKTIDDYQYCISELLNTIKQLKDISFHYYSVQQSSSETIKHYSEEFYEKLIHLTEVIVFCQEHRHNRLSQEKIAKLEKKILADDVHFLENIRASIARNHGNSENNHYRGQIIKINRSVLIASQSCLKGLSLYVDIV